MLAFLNIFFFCFHTILIPFNLFGWIFRKTRLANLVTLGCTAFSWFLLGIWYGFGYCPSTDWHWQVRAGLGLEVDTRSYTAFLVNMLTGMDVNPVLVDRAAVILLFLAFSASLSTNIRNWTANTRK